MYLSPNLCLFYLFTFCFLFLFRDYFPFYLPPALFLGWKNYVKCELHKKTFDLEIPVVDLKRNMDQNNLIQEKSVAKDKNVKNFTGDSIGNVSQSNINESNLSQSNINEGNVIQSNVNESNVIQSEINESNVIQSEINESTSDIEDWMQLQR